MPNERLVKKCYIMMRYFDDLGNNNWCTHIRKLLQDHGYGYMWDMQDIQNERTFMLAFVQRLKDHFLQSWASYVTRNRKLILYKNFKLEFSHEHYLDILNVRKFRHALAQLRTGHHALEIEKGRYNNTPKDRRLCKMCLFNIEDEYHFVLGCNADNDLRYIYLPKEYYSQPNLHKLNMLMSSRLSDTIHSLAKFVFQAFKRRSTLLTK